MSDSLQLLYVDGWFGDERQSTVVPSPNFPFRNNPETPDTYARRYLREFFVPPGPPGYLPRVGVRNSWRNLLAYSEDFTNAAWTKTNATATANVATAPDGQTTMGKLLESTATGEHSLSVAATATAVETELTIFVRGGLGRALLRVAFVDSAAATFSAYFDLDAGVARSPSAGVVAEVSALGNSDFRLVVRFTPAAGAGTVKYNLATAVGTISYAGDAAKGAYVWGACLAAGSSTPYVSTTTVARTASAPLRDATDPLALLIREDDPSVVTSRNGIARRLYSRIPNRQTVPGSTFVTKPEIPGSFPQLFGAYIIVKPSPNVATYDLYTPITVVGDSGPLVGGGAPTGGQYTASFEGQTTTPLAYNAGPSAFQTALNTLSTIAAKGGVTVTGDYVNGFVVTFNTIPTGVVNVGGLTSAGGSVYTFPNNGAQNWVQQLCVLTTTGDVFTGGTLTVTILGQTTATIAYNATQATAGVALNALSNVAARGGIVALTFVPSILIQSNFIQLNFRFAYPAIITIDATTLSPSGSTGTAVATNPFNSIQTVSFVAGAGSVRQISTTSAHGIAAGDPIVVKAGSEFFEIAAGQITIPSTTTIGIPASAGDVAVAPDAITQLGKKTGSQYTAGLKETRCDEITDFYLIGWTPGIASKNDIPLPTYQGDPTALLLAIFAGTTSINVEVGQLAPWEESTVLARTIKTINAATL